MPGLPGNGAALAHRIAAAGLVRVENHRHDALLALQRHAGGGVAAEVDDRVHVGLGAGRGDHGALVAAGVGPGAEHRGGDVAHVLDLADLAGKGGHVVAVLLNGQVSGQAADGALHVHVAQANVRGRQRLRCVLRASGNDAGDAIGVLPLQQVGRLALQVEGERGVDVGARGAVGPEHVGARLDDAEAQRLDGIGRLLAAQRHRLLENGILVGVVDDVGQLNEVAVLLGGHSNVDLRELLAGGRHTFRQGGHSQGQGGEPAEGHALGRIGRQGLGLEKTLNNQKRVSALQEFLGGMSRSAGRNVAVSGSGISHDRAPCGLIFVPGGIKVVLVGC